MEGAIASGGGKDGVGKRAKKEEERTLVMAATVGTTVAIAEEQH